MAKSPPDPKYQAALANYERLVGSVPELELKGAANRYTSVNGNMTSYLHPGGSLALRLPPGEREAFLAAYRTTLFEAYGVIQKEYVRVPEDLLADIEKLAPYFRAGYAWAAALKPKPTTKQK